MKRQILIGVLLIQFCILAGAPITKTALSPVVRSFIENYFPSDIKYSIRDILPVAYENKTTFYIVNLTPQGWLLVSGDDKVEPVLGYNYTGAFSPDFQSSLSVSKWIQHYNRNIVTAADDKTLKRNRLWDGYVTTKAAGVVTIAPFIEVTWDQDATFNRFCPEDAAGPGGHAYVGCVAVAMAQAMSVYDYPAQGIGTKSYAEDDYGTLAVRFNQESFKWDSMGNSTADKYNARLLYCCAVSVTMDFGPNGSGSYTSRIPGAMRTYFKYYSGIKRVVKSGTDSAWTQLLVDELKEGRPIVYSGDADDGEAGHAFDIDGVNVSKYFHLNWGWSGSYNGYFIITDLTPGGYNFTQNHEAVINFRPAVYCPTDVQLTKKTVKEGLPTGAYVGKVKVTDEAVDNTYSLTLLGDSVDTDTYLPPDFYLSHDSVRTSKTFQFPEKSAYTLFIRVTDQFNNTIQKKFIITILVGTSTDESVINAESVTIYPNPSNGQFFIDIPEIPGSLALELMDISGRVVYKNAYTLDNNGISVSYNVPGIYLLKISTETGATVYKKLVIHK